MPDPRNLTLTDVVVAEAMEEQMQERMLQLALLTTECPSCEGHPPLPMGPCQRCKNTGKVYLLDPYSKFLRVKCPLSLGDWARYRALHPSEVCPECQGRGWTPATEAIKYAQAAWTLSDLPDGTCGDTLASNIMAAIQAAFNAGTDPGEAAFAVVAEALLKEKP